MGKAESEVFELNVLNQIFLIYTPTLKVVCRFFIFPKDLMITTLIFVF